MLTSDSSGRWGCGAYCGGRWFQLQWSSMLEGTHITIKVLVPIVLGAALWGNDWKGCTVQARWYNSAAVAVINWGNCQDANVMHLVQCLSFIKAKFQFSLFASHIKGVDNYLAGALSRNNLDTFRLCYPQALPHPIRIPQELLDLTILSKPDWTSARRTELWKVFSRWPSSFISPFIWFSKTTFLRFLW